MEKGRVSEIELPFLECARSQRSLWGVLKKKKIRTFPEIEKMGGMNSREGIVNRRGSKMIESETLTGIFAEFISNLKWIDIPPEVRKAALDLFGDWLANAAGGSRTPLGQALYAIARSVRGQGRSHLAASLEQTHPLIAAMVNSGSSHTLEFDDTHWIGLYHPGSPIIGAAFAWAEQEKTRGEDFLAGLVAGYEISLRIAIAINPPHYRVWHTTGTVGTLGAAAAVCRVAKFDAAMTLNALGLAGTQAAGLWEVLPSAPSAKGLHPAKAAQGGILAALLAMEEIEGPATILEGPRGFFVAMVPEKPKTEELCADLGKVWRIVETTIKPYPICGHIHTSAEAAFLLREEVGPERISKLSIYSNSTSIRIAGNRNPRGEFQAKFSIPYCVAVALLYGRITQAEFAPEILEDVKVRSLMDRVELVVDEEYERVFEHARPTRIEAITKDGQKIAKQSSKRKGGLQYPLSREEKRDKFIRLAGSVWGEEAATVLIENIEEIEQADSVCQWMERHMRRFFK